MSIYHIIYKTTHTNGKFYIGRHSTNDLNDGYLGSGKWVKSIKDKSTLSREIITEANSIEELCRLEEHHINIYYGNPLCMNYKRSSNGWNSLDVSEFNREIQENGKSRSQNRGKKLYESGKSALFKQNKEGINPFYKKEDGTSVALNRVKNGTHNLVGVVTCVDKIGNIHQINKEEYKKQLGPQEEWEYVCVSSDEGKYRMGKQINKIICINIFGETAKITNKRFSKLKNDYWVDINSDEGIRRKNFPENSNNKQKYYNSLAKQTILAKYGVDNASKISTTKEKIKEKNNKKYGTDHFFQSEEGKAKIKQIRKNDPVFICEICNQQIKGKGNLLSHMRKHRIQE